jgi:hypothetical protein
MSAASLSVTGNDRIQPGGNRSPFDLIVEEIDGLYSEASNWADGEPIQSQAQCDALDKLDKDLLALDKRREELRVEEKRPLDDQIKEIQNRHNPVKDKIARAREALNKLRADWKIREQRRKDAIAAQAREEQRKLEEQRLAAARAAAQGDLAAAERAADLAADLQVAAGDAKRMEKAAKAPAGLRTVYRAELVDERAAIAHYWGTRRQDFIDLVCNLAAADVRNPATRQIPGFKTIEESKAL